MKLSQAKALAVCPPANSEEKQTTAILDLVLIAQPAFDPPRHGTSSLAFPKASASDGFPTLRRDDPSQAGDRLSGLWPCVPTSCYVES